MLNRLWIHFTVWILGVIVIDDAVRVIHNPIVLWALSFPALISLIVELKD